MRVLKSVIYITFELCKHSKCNDGTVYFYIQCKLSIGRSWYRVGNTKRRDVLSDYVFDI